MFDAAVSGGTDVDVDGVGESGALLLLLLEDDDCFLRCMNASIVCIRFVCCGLLSRYVRISFELWPGGGGRGNGTDDAADAADVVSAPMSVAPVAVVPLIVVEGPWILFIAMIT